MGSGLLIDGRTVPVDGLDIVNEHDDPSARLDPGDYHARPTPWIRQIILHTTKGIWPQYIRPGAGQPGKHLAVGEFWRADPTHSAAHMVVGRAGEVSCLADLQRVAAYHATVSNAWSIGIESYQEQDGGIYEATLVSTVALVLALVRLFGIQLQVPGRPYRNGPLGRLADGGKMVVGVFGHRDNTNRRGRGDPGDEIFRRLITAGAEPLVTDAGSDLHAWELRQAALGLPAGQRDGVPGPATTDLLRQRGFPGGVYALGTADQRAAIATGADRPAGDR